MRVGRGCSGLRNSISPMRHRKPSASKMRRPSGDDGSEPIRRKVVATDGPRVSTSLLRTMKKASKRGSTWTAAATIRVPNSESDSPQSIAQRVMSSERSASEMTNRESTPARSRASRMTRSNGKTWPRRSSGTSSGLRDSSTKAATRSPTTAKSARTWLAACGSQTWGGVAISSDLSCVFGFLPRALPDLGRGPHPGSDRPCWRRQPAAAQFVADRQVLRHRQRRGG